MTADELDTFNRIVNLYLDFAELQAKSKRAMYMKDWIQKLDAFLKISERELLTNAGKISKELAQEKANIEYSKFHSRSINSISEVEKHFLQSVEKAEQLLSGEKRRGNNGSYNFQ